MDLETLLFMFLPPVCAVALSFFTKSTLAKQTLCWGGLWFILNFLLAEALLIDCGFNDFSFQTCQYLPQPLSDFYTLPHFFNLALYVFVAPFLLLLAGVFELVARKDQAQP